ncbi:cytochrome c family protein [Phenylobacterium hankyongense]|uniref:Cytochrome c family protein n=1 Tax=Phenylobacterium hankyongense TaxID=1813876 RepID=A0A328B236_9CAUL|nr:cytochrome c family protein [Phenylobacterium hankyongense]RAK59894.1 cytochrome c family protein [Phenylobacterium hankyongense]
MSDLTFNKVAGAVLATGLAIVGLRELSSGVFTQEPVAKPGYAVEVAADTGGGAAAPEVPPDWGTVLPTADVKAGEAVFQKCKSCHNADNGGANGTGPNLWGVVGRKPGSHPGFAYSPGMEAFGAKQPIWDYEHIYEFVKSPQAYINGTKMTFVGLKKPEDRINVIAYLHSQGSSLPIPTPNPAAAAAAAPAAAAPGAAPAAQPVATGSTATPAAGAGGPAGQGPGAPTQQAAKPGNPN